jgi:hypothetical protein
MVTDAPAVVLVGGDLNARARVGGAVARAGGDLVTTTPSGLAHALEGRTAKVVIVDLDGVGSAALPLISAARTGAARVLGYFSHVDHDLGEKAHSAGIEALPRGRFWRELSDLIERELPVSLEVGEDEDVGEEANERGRMTRDSRPASPEQPDQGGFEEGVADAAETPDEEAEGRFSTGVEEQPGDPEKHRKTRFSEGEEVLPDTPDKTAERRFSEGQERGSDN